MSLDFDLQEVTLSRLLWEQMGIMSLVADNLQPAFTEEDEEQLRVEVARRVVTGTSQLGVIAHLIREQGLHPNGGGQRPLRYENASTHRHYWGVITGEKLDETVIKDFERGKYTSLFLTKDDSRQGRKTLQENQQRLARVIRGYRTHGIQALDEEAREMAEVPLYLEGWFPTTHHPQDQIWGVFGRRKRGLRGIKKISRLAVFADYEFDELFRASKILRSGKRLTINEIARYANDKKLKKIAEAWGGDRAPEQEDLIRKLGDDIELTDWLGERVVTHTREQAYQLYNSLRHKIGRSKKWKYVMQKNGLGASDYYADPDKKVHLLKLRLRPTGQPDYIELTITDLPSFLYDEFGPHAHYRYERKQETGLKTLRKQSPSSGVAYDMFVERGLRLFEGVPHVSLFPNRN